MLAAWLEGSLPGQGLSRATAARTPAVRVEDQGIDDTVDIDARKEIIEPLLNRR